MKNLINLGVTVLILLFILISIFVGISKYKEMQSQIETQLEIKLSKENKIMIESLLLKEQLKQKDQSIDSLNKEIFNYKELLKLKDQEISQKIDKRNSDLIQLIESLRSDKNSSTQISSLLLNIKTLERENEELLSKLKEQVSKKNFYKDGIYKNQNTLSECQSQLLTKKEEIDLLKRDLNKPKFECVQKKETVQNQQKNNYEPQKTYYVKKEVDPFLHKPKQINKNTYPKVDELN